MLYIAEYQLFSFVIAQSAVSYGSPHCPASQESIIQYTAGGKSKCKIQSPGSPECVSPSHEELYVRTTYNCKPRFMHNKNTKKWKWKQINIWQYASSKLWVEETYRMDSKKRKIQQCLLVWRRFLSFIAVSVTHCQIKVMLTKEIDECAESSTEQKESEKEETELNVLALGMLGRAREKRYPLRILENISSK